MIKEYPMISSVSKNLILLKKEFIKIYDGQSQIQEVIPILKSDLFPLPQHDLGLLHQFAKNNPIYYNSFEKTIGNIPCIVYEGDINKYWLNSIQYGASCAPFSPTWIMSAYLLALSAKELGFQEIIDVGSGDGRIAFCAKILGLESYSIEIDEMLVDLQNVLNQTFDFHTFCSDATTFDYPSLNLLQPAFFIGGLAQMGGVELSSGVIKKISAIPSVWKNSGWVFAGTVSPKYSPDPKNKAGWGSLIEDYNLELIKTVNLPTIWTFREPDDTLYVFCRTRL